MNADEARTLTNQNERRTLTWGVRFKLWQMERKIARKARRGHSELDTDTVLWFWYANPDIVFNELRKKGYSVKYAGSYLGYIYTVRW